MTTLGHEDAFPRTTLSARCRFSHGTFAGTRGNRREAPVPVVRIYEENFLGFSYVFCPGAQAAGAPNNSISDIATFGDIGPLTTAQGGSIPMYEIILGLIGSPVDDPFDKIDVTAEMAPAVCLITAPRPRAVSAIRAG